MREGTYYLSEPLRLSAEDSGSLDCPITYKAFPGEKPILSGGKVITGWRSHEGQIMCTELPEVKEGKWNFRQLFFRDHRQIRARCPNFDADDRLYGGWAFVEEVLPEDTTREDTVAQRVSPTIFGYDPDLFPRRWARPQQGEISFFPGSVGLAILCPSSK